MATDSELRKAFVPGELWPDDKGVHINAHGGGILCHDGVYYWFGEHKIAGTAGNTAQVGVHVYSSQDLYNWKDEGIALEVSSDPGSDIVKGCTIERPKVIHNAKTGKFVMWFHLELKGQGYLAARVGVAVSDTVTGPYRFLESFRPDAGFWPENVSADFKRPLNDIEAASLKNEKFYGDSVTPELVSSICRRDFQGGQMARDMTLFVDDDGAAYLIAASEENATLHISQLTGDYLKTSGRYVRVTPCHSNEAPALFKRHGSYYLITSGCTGWTPNAARSFVAPSIWGPWTALGNPCVGPENVTSRTFESQSTYVLPVTGKSDAFIFMADRWVPENAIDGRYIWLPLQFKDGKPFLDWLERWDLSFFDEKPSR